MDRQTHRLTDRPTDINVTSKVLTSVHKLNGHVVFALSANNVTSRVSHVFSRIRTIFKLNHRIQLFTCFHYIHIEKTAPPPDGHVFPPIMTIFELPRNVTSRVGHVFFLETNVLTKFYEDWTKNVTSRVFTCFHYKHIDHVFSPIWTISELFQDNNATSVFTKFHDDWAKIVTSRVFTRKTALPPGGHVYQRTGTIF
ncbi:hypothetical protein DPMN_002831 [Dreissena polymorpha]|uniref:Uncharacterized protein n=1 Tax=Dreissena polymorpha TaxID=45954 RepID=A0A9D4MKF3_DREPO|nr:hypothetical protein DPMN_002831 [Dreissena polymorpha]